MAVVPFDLEGVVAAELDAGRGDIGRDGIDVEGADAGQLVDAAGTGAVGPQRLEGDPPHAQPRPGDFEHALIAEGFDRRRLLVALGPCRSRTVGFGPNPCPCARSPASIWRR